MGHFKRAFVRYTKKGVIVPGSLILTSGSYPDGPGLWKEVDVNPFCCADNGCNGPYFINHLQSDVNPSLKFPGTSCTDNDCNVITGYNSIFEYPSGTSLVYKEVIIKYDKDGNTIWQKVQEIERPWDPPLAGTYIIISSISVDSNNDIYVCDTFSLYKLSGIDGSLLWFKALYYTNVAPPPYSTISLQYNHSMYVNTNDELYLSFSNYSNETIINPCDKGVYPEKKVTLVKLNPATGNSIVEKTINISNTLSTLANSTYGYIPMTGDSDGNIILPVYYAICYENPPGSSDYFGLCNAIKFDSNLNYISNFQFNVNLGFNVFPSTFPGQTYIDYYNLHLDKNDNFYFNSGGGGSIFSGPIKFIRSKVDSSYNLKWCKRIDYIGALTYLDFYQTVSDQDGNSYILGVDYDSIGHLMKIDTNGNLLWVTQITDSTGNTFLFDSLWYNNPNQLSVSKNTITMILGTIDDGTGDSKALFIKYPKDQQLLGTYGTTTFTDVTSEYVVSSLSPSINSVLIDVVPTNYYTPNLTPYLYSIVPATNYTVSTTII